jgi:hypothetical protein
MTDIARTGRGRSTLLWVIALILMLGTAAFQRRTGPTIPVWGDYQVAGQTYTYHLLRSAYSTEETEVHIPEPAVEAEADLSFRRYPDGGEWTTVPMGSRDDKLVAYLPPQAPLGKLEYFVSLRAGGQEVRLPTAERAPVVIRYKDPVPRWILVPHILFMFLGVLVAMRAGLSALSQPEGMKPLAWTAFWSITIGGLVIGPFVSGYAFHLPWTGVPVGWDITDNKTVVMWLAWLVAGLVVRRADAPAPTGSEGSFGRRRLTVLLAAIVTVAVYLIPHST